MIKPNNEKEGEKSPSFIFYNFTFLVTYYNSE